jgi:hypothetical protein
MDEPIATLRAAYHHILKLARASAYLAGSDAIPSVHLPEKLIASLCNLWVLW